MDVLHPQVHGEGAAIDLPPSVRLLTGDVTHAPDIDTVLRLTRPSQIVHLAAETGTAQSLSEATRHSSVNVVGTTQLLDALSRAALVPDQFVLASSRAVYGEGPWRSGSQVFYPHPRSHAQLLASIWDPQGLTDNPAVPLPSCAGRTEPRPTNIYAATKLAQEHILAAVGGGSRHQAERASLAECVRAGSVADEFVHRHRRSFRAIGPQQRTLEVYEDGRIVRDFVYIDDVVDALFAAIERPAAEPRCLDIGSGISTTIHELAKKIAAICDAPEPVIVGKFRDGDVRAAKCDIEPATKELEWRPEWTLEDGLRGALRLDRWGR